MKVTNLKIYHLLTALEKISGKALIALTLFITFSLGVVDYFTGFELELSLQTYVINEVHKKDNKNKDYYYRLARCRYFFTDCFGGSSAIG